MPADYGVLEGPTLSDGVVNSPELSDSKEPKRRSIETPAEAWQIASALEEENRERNIKNARIMAKYNAEQPYPTEKLKNEGLAWKANFSTKPLGTLIDKVAPRFTSAVKGVRYLTASQLPEQIPGAHFKTEKFRREVTETARAREGWDDLISDIATENALFGFTAAAWLDKFSWLPSFYRQDEFFVPSDTKQSTGKCQAIVLKDTYLIHELFKFIEDSEAAEMAGWEVQAVIKAINSAMPDKLRSNESDPYRIYQDLIRGCSISAAYSGAKVVTVYSVLVAEVDGKVSQWTVNGSGEHELLLKKLDAFEDMPDAAVFFAFQKANGKLHGSKGIGREVYAMASILDRARNEVVDRLQLSGKVILSAAERDILRFKMHVHGNSILIGDQYTISQQKIEGSVEEFFALDQFLTGLLDQIAGSTSPKVFEQERVTKAAVELYAARDEERTDVIIERFMSQFARMMNTIQRRMCDPETHDADAKAMQERLLQFMSKEELKALAEQPAVSTVADFSERDRQQVVLLAQEAAGNPMYNQRELTVRKVTAMFDAEFAEAVVLPENDPTEEAEQRRLQQLELLALTEGQPVPISPRDNHLIHLEALVVPLQSAAQAAVQDANAAILLTAVGTHAEQHLLTAESLGVDGKALEPFYNMVQSAKAAVLELEKQAEELAAQGLDPNGNPAVPDPTMAGAVAPPGIAGAPGVPPPVAATAAI